MGVRKYIFLDFMSQRDIQRKMFCKLVFSRYFDHSSTAGKYILRCDTVHTHTNIKLKMKFHKTCNKS